MEQRGDFRQWVDLCYRYDGSYPLSLLHVNVSSQLYASLGPECGRLGLFFTQANGSILHGGIWVDDRGTSLVDVHIDLTNTRPIEGYAGVQDACRSRLSQVHESSETGLVAMDIPLVCGDRLMGCLNWETTKALARWLETLEAAEMPLLLAGALRYAEAARDTFLERRYLMSSVNIHRHYQKDFSADHILEAVCYHIQTTLGLDRCLILGETAGGWRRFCAGLTYSDDMPRVDPEPWSPHADFEEKIEGTVIILALSARGRHAAVVFDNSISQIPFGERDIQQLTMVRDALSVLWAFTEDLESERTRGSLDPLTGCWNRDYGFSFIDEWLTNLRLGRDTLALLFIDADHFKRINDQHGHLVGDRTLEALARHLIETTANQGVVIRYGGDEFLIACPRMTQASADRLAKSLVETLDWPHDLPKATVSVGVALGPHQGQRAEDLIEQADRAMYQAKRRGGNRWETAERAGNK